MIPRTRSALVLLLLALLLIGLPLPVEVAVAQDRAPDASNPQAAGETRDELPASTFDWTVSLRAVEQRVWAVQLDLRNIDALRKAGRLNDDGSITFHMPNWSPGAYSMGTYGRFVEAFSATTIPATLDGFTSEPRPLPVAHPSLDTWTIQLPADADGKPVNELRIQYTTTTGRSQTTGRLSRVRGDFLGTGMFLYLTDSTDLPATLRFADLPEGWQAHCPLPRSETPGVYRAVDFDQLADAPCAFGPFGSRSFRVDNTTIEIVVSADPDRVDGAHAKLRQPVERIVRAAAELMDGLPFDRYVFFYFFSNWGRGGGGLEHLNSTQIWLPARMLENDPETIAMVTAHELFHAWNVKRLRAAPINPYDYSKVPKLDCLWFHEGVTNYYTYVLMARAGLIQPEYFYRRLAGLLQRVNRTNDYYHQGECWGFLLDCLIRRRTNNEKSLDDVFHELWNRYGKDVKPFDQTAGISRVIKDVTGQDLWYFLERWVLGKADTPVAEVLRCADVPYGANGAERAWLGFDGEFDRATSTVVVTDVVPHSRAAEAGLAVGDVIRQLADAPVTASWQRVLEGSPAGMRVNLVLRRKGADADTTLAVPLGNRLDSPFRIILPDADSDSLPARMLRGIVADRTSGADREEDF